MNRKLRSIRPLALPLLALVALSGCNDEDSNDAIHPVRATLVTPSVNGDPLIFFQSSPSDTNPNDDTVTVDIMLRADAGLTFDYINMEVLFDPTIIHVGQVDLTSTPLGDCTQTGPTFPICLSNANAANTSGDLIIGISRTDGPSATITGTGKLLTLRFIGSTVGTSTLSFETALPSGDCEILADAVPDPVNLNVSCDGTGSYVTVAR